MIHSLAKKKKREKIRNLYCVCYYVYVYVLFQKRSLLDILLIRGAIHIYQKKKIYSNFW